jgi:hypothetical protein
MGELDGDDDQERDHTMMIDVVGLASTAQAI